MDAHVEHLLDLYAQTIAGERRWQSMSEEAQYGCGWRRTPSWRSMLTAASNSCGTRAMAMVPSGSAGTAARAS